MQNLHFLRIERIAIVTAEIAHAVDEEIVARGESTNGEVVALRAALAGRETDTCDITQRVAKRSRALLLHELMRNDSNGLRGIQKRFGKFRRRGGELGRIGLNLDYGLDRSQS